MKQNGDFPGVARASFFEQTLRAQPSLIGAKNSLERHKSLLIKRVNRGLQAPSRFPPRFNIKLS